MLATAATVLPTGPDWSYEVKFDGYRALAFIECGTVTIRSRRLNNLTKSYPALVTVLSNIRADSAIIDGEIVALDPSGRPNFQALQNSRRATLAFYAFDLLSWNGRDLTVLPLERRRAQLAELVKGTQVLFSETLPGTANQVENAVRALGLEGVIAKRRGSKYAPGLRSAQWLKVRFSRRQEFVVGGYRPIGRDFDALLVGYYDGARLCFAAKVRAGFTASVRSDLVRRLGRPVTRCPFDDLPRDGRGRFSEGIGAEDMREFHWVRPRLLVEVAFVEWTESGLLRHPKFVAVRTDKKPTDVHRI